MDVRSPRPTTVTVESSPYISISRKKYLPADTVGWSSGSLMTPALYFFMIHLVDHSHGSDHYFHACCPYVPNFNIKKKYLCRPRLWAGQVDH